MILRAVVGVVSFRRPADKGPAKALLHALARVTLALVEELVAKGVGPVAVVGRPDGVAGGAACADYVGAGDGVPAGESGGGEGEG